MAALVDKLPLDRETAEVLLGRDNRLRPIYQLILAQESGEWQHSAHLAQQLNLDDGLVAEYYWDALQWARQVGGGE